ncbi:hypothetical protein ANO14919_046950 [Xylariales sp. No.14919]|nr:hypothetical protein ANO14919_046950 [Xylariales sp. No.14919]
MSVRSEPALRTGTTGFSTQSTTIPEISEGEEGGSPPCLLRWTDAEITKTHVQGAAQLRSCIQENGNATRHLLVFRGLPVDCGAVLREAADVDASFIEAHAGRRSYRPRRTRVKADWAYFDYPELVHRSFPNARQQKSAPNDLVGEPPTYATASAAGDRVMLCRASMWLSEQAHILCLDRPTWDDPKSGVSRRRYKAYTIERMPDGDGISTITMQMDSNGNMTPLGDEIPSLETMLYDSLQGGCEDLVELLEELVISKWDDFFEALSLDLPRSSAETTALFSRVMGCLERNLDVSRRRHKVRLRGSDTRPDIYSFSDAKSQSATTEWEALLSRLNRRVQLFGHLTATVSKAETPSADAGLEISSAGSRGEKHDCKPRNNNYSNTPATSSSPSDENQRSLNRVAYLGGVLLPFSVVSGILAIEDPYGPSDAQFWIFWAVTIPLTLLTLGVIYADSIRKVQVWVEVAAAASSGQARPAILTEAAVDVDVEQQLAVPASGRAAQPIALAPSAPLAEDSTSADGEEDGEEREPDMMVEKRWGNPPAYSPGVGPGAGPEWARKKWKKEELGWVGACATLFQVYKLKKGIPPRHLRHSDRRDGLLRRARTD